MNLAMNQNADVDSSGHMMLSMRDVEKTKLLDQKLKGMGLDSVLMIVDSVDENLYLASRNLPNVAVVEPRYADPLSLIYFKKVVATRAAIDKLQEMYA